jgi:Predicted membrane protein (DUF2142)
VSRPPAPLAALLVVAFVLSLAWSLVTPPLQGPDEDAHVAYVQRIVETGSLPQDVEEGRAGYSTELQAAQTRGGLFETITSPATKPHATEAEREAFERDSERLGGDARGDGTGAQSANVNPPLYYLYAAVGYVAGLPGDFFARQQLMRLLGIPLLLVVVVMTWLLVAEVLPRPAWARVVAAGVVALHPVLGFLSGVVNPDIALAAIWSTFLWHAVRTVRYGPTMRRAIGLGLLAAASALVQPRGLTLGLPAVIVLAVALWRHGIGLRAALRPAAACLGLAVAGVALYWVLTRVGGGAPAAGQVVGTGTFNARQFLSYLWQFYLPPLRIMDPLPGNILGYKYVWVESYFGVYGSLDVFLPQYVLDRLYSASLYGLVALAICLVLRLEQVRRHWPVLLVLLATAGTYLFALHYAAYNTLIGTGGSASVLVGRYLLPLVPLMGLAIAFVATTLPRRWGVYAGLAALVAGVMLSMAGLGVTFVRYYA